MSTNNEERAGTFISKGGNLYYATDEGVVFYTNMKRLADAMETSSRTRSATSSACPRTRRHTPPTATARRAAPSPTGRARWITTSRRSPKRSQQSTASRSCPSCRSSPADQRATDGHTKDHDLMQLLQPLRDDLARRMCWACTLVYDDNEDEGNPEARCPQCKASQALCEQCGDPGADQCVSGCERVLCPGCWPRHLDSVAQPKPPTARWYSKAPARIFCIGGGHPPVLASLDLNAAERQLVIEALERCGSVVHAAIALGTTRFAVQRRIIKHRIQWPRSETK